jgi:hypothetical protein
MKAVVGSFAGSFTGSFWVFFWAISYAFLGVFDQNLARVNAT